jgi:hypothetical protein
VGVTRWFARRRRARRARKRPLRRVAQPRPPLRALTAAALALPGLAGSRANAAEGDDFHFRYGRYEETHRDLHGIESAYDPIEVDSLITGGRITPLDRLHFDFEYLQDTWSGATPITTAPLLLGGNRPTSPDGISGATPFIQGDLYFDSEFQPVVVDAAGEVTAVDTRLVHTLSSASPETRREGDFELGYAWDAIELDLGGGLSSEHDFDAAYVELAGNWQLDEKRTRVDLGASYTHGDTHALLDHDAVPYIDTSAFAGRIEIDPETGDRKLGGTRHDWGTQLGLTRILSKRSLLETSVGYLRSTGYLANPYKVMEVAFIDPEQQFLAPPGGYFAQVRALLEKLPSERNQINAGARLVHYVEATDASLRLAYGFAHDDWGIDAHTLEASWGQPLPWGFLITPRIRYYTQSQADFYEPYLVSDQAYVTVVSDPDTGDIISITPFDHALLPSHYSSDQRYSGFGALGGGVSLSLALARGVTLSGDFEYYAHRGDLKLGGGGAGDYSDFDFYSFSAGLRLDSSALHALGLGFDDDTGAIGAAEHAGHGGAYTPAGVLLGHMLRESGEAMVGLRYQFSTQSGDMLHGTSSAGDPAIIANGCDEIPCRTAPNEMDMHMFMLEIMFAPTDWLNLMLMPQFVDMSMDVRALEGAEPDEHSSHSHSTGGVGDLQAFTLIELFESDGQRLHLGLGISAPTGDVNLKLRRTHQEDRGLTHYGMQLGSGTWDFLPSLTYTGELGRWSFGGQASGVTRLESANASGYALGDVFQATAWGALEITDWLSASTRALYTWQGDLTGQYGKPHSESGPMDFPENYGGHFFDLGFGLGARVPAGYLAGNSLRVEWLQPVVDAPNGYQLERRGTLFAVWSVEF